MKRIINRICFLILTAIIAISCKKTPNSAGLEFMPDMYRSASYETYSSNPNFEDGMTARKPVEGTVPRGFNPMSYPNNNEGYEAAGRELKNPVELNELNLNEGKRLYSLYCGHCHGPEGKGDGKLVQNEKFPPPPSYASAQLKDLSEGKMYFSITYGKNLMGSHASQVSPEERWKIIMHIQTLQQPLSQ
jgi:mono/diheme cytochrome c family protein